jgi:hypothetical protein
MAFSDFKYPDVLTEFGLTYEPPRDLFPGVPPVPVRPATAAVVRVTAPLATMLNTEKARSEWIIAPLLADLWDRYHGRVGLYSGHPFPADPDAGLTGACDFLFSRSPQQLFVTPPAVVVVEAKNESIPGGMGQCVAEMVGAQRFNRRHGVVIDPVYGCVTTGSVWRFARLAGSTFTLDLYEHGIDAADRILGILASVLGPIPDAGAAA